MARNAQGSYLDHSANASPLVWGELEECKNIDGPTSQSGQSETTHLRSTAKEFLAQLQDAGEVTLSCNYIGGTVQLALREMFRTQADPQHFRIHLPTDSTKTIFDQFWFRASVTQWQLGAQVDNAIPLTLRLKVSGDVDAAFNVTE